MEYQPYVPLSDPSCGKRCSTYLGTVVLNGNLHVAISILLLAKTLEGGINLNEESTVAWERGFIYADNIG